MATRDRPALLKELIESIGRSAVVPMEVVIADDGSSPPVDGPSLSEGRPFAVRVVRSDRSQGPAKARNRAVHASRGDILLFTDDDCVVHERWVEQHALALQRGGDALGGTGGRVLARDRDVVSRYCEFHGILEAKPHDRAHPARIPYLVTANCAVWRTAFMRAGGFDEGLAIAGGEDVAFSMRLAKRGYVFERAVDAVVWHRFRPGLREFYRTFYRYGLGGRYVVDRYLSR